MVMFLLVSFSSEGEQRLDARSFRIEQNLGQLYTWFKLCLDGLWSEQSNVFKVVCDISDHICCSVNTNTSVQNVLV